MTLSRPVLVPPTGAAESAGEVLAKSAAARTHERRVRRSGCTGLVVSGTEFEDAHGAEEAGVHELGVGLELADVGAGEALSFGQGGVADEAVGPEVDDLDFEGVGAGAVGGGDLERAAVGGGAGVELDSRLGAEGPAFEAGEFNRGGVAPLRIEGDLPRAGELAHDGGGGGVGRSASGGWIFSRGVTEDDEGGAVWL